MSIGRGGDAALSDLQDYIILAILGKISLGLPMELIPVLICLVKANAIVNPAREQ